MLMQTYKGTLNRYVKKISRYFLILAIFISCFFFYQMQPYFLSLNNIMDIINTTSFVGIMAIGMTIIMSSGEMNLAVGAEATLAAAVVARLLDIQGFHGYPLALLLGLLAVLLAGGMNAFFSIKIGVPSFIVTIAMATFVGGFNRVLTGNVSFFSRNWPESFSFLGQTLIGGLVPITTIIFIVLSITLIICMDHTSFGRYVSAVGANPIACTNIGINVKKIKVLCFLLCALLTGFDGVMLSSQLMNVDPMLGSSLLMDAMAATMLGATFLRPGRYNIQGTIVASLLLTVIQNGTISIGASDFVTDLVHGSVLLIAVAVIALTRKGGLPSVNFNV